MSVRERGCFTTTWSAAGTTLGSNLLFVGIVATGSAALGAIQISDGTKAAFVLAVGITGGASYTPAYPIAFNSAMIVTVISTAGYSIAYMPRP